MNALDVQVAGSHYKKFEIQPIEFAMTMGYDACFHSALKYLARHPEKGGIQDIEKARHFMALRQQIVIKHDMRRLQDAMRVICRLSNLSWLVSGDTVMPERADDMDVFIVVNGFSGTPEARAMRALHNLHLDIGGSWQSQFEMALTDVLAQYDNPAREYCAADR